MKTARFVINANEIQFYEKAAEFICVNIRFETVQEAIFCNLEYDFDGEFKSVCYMAGVYSTLAELRQTREEREHIKIPPPNYAVEEIMAYNDTPTLPLINVEKELTDNGEPNY